MKPVRTRFAPSPTGFLHVGGIRTALFAWLIARQHNGQFILRLEDTDKNREVEGSGGHIIESLQWLGLQWDEGPNKNGDFGQYKQSNRLENYRKWAQKLIDEGRAYVDPYSPEEVQKFRDEAIANKQPFLYRNHRPKNPPRWDGAQSLRFKSEPKNYNWRDEVMGDLSTGPEVIDDIIIIKSDGYPTYNFAHIVDDAEMKITHIIRGQEFLASVPNYLNIYEALELSPPIMATMPPVLGPNGNKKLSKRDGAKDVLDYRKEGYLPEAINNFLASLGWNDGSEQEVFAIEELIQKFDLSKVQKSGARFDEQRLLWLNGAHIRKLSLNDLYHKVANYWPDEAKDSDDVYKKQVLSLVQERLKYFAELPELTNFFFTDLPVNSALISTHKQLKKLDKDNLKSLLHAAQTELQESDFTVNDLTNRLNALLTITNTKPAVLFSLIRIAITQAPASPGLADTLAVLGKNVSLRRLDTQLQHVQ